MSTKVGNVESLIRGNCNSVLCYVVGLRGGEFNVSSKNSCQPFQRRTRASFEHSRAQSLYASNENSLDVQLTCSMSVLDFEKKLCT